MSNRLTAISVLGVILVLSGCDSLLYSNTLAPVFSANKAQTTPPAKLPTPRDTASIEQPGGIIVQQAGNDPYATPTRPVDMTKVTPTAEQPVAVATNTAKTDVKNTTAQASERIKEGSEVLANGGATVQATPRPVVASKQTAPDKTQVVQRPAATASQKAQATTATEKTATEVAERTSAKPVPAAPQTATRALLQEAKGAVAAGNYDKAASALERAHRIEPGNAKILYDIAQIRYAQGNYRQASSFASKAATYSSNPTLSKKVWTLLSNARKQLGNSTGAAAAAQKAASF